MDDGITADQHLPNPGSGYALHNVLSPETTAPAPLAWGPTSIVSVPNTSSQNVETHTPAHLTTVAFTPLRYSQGPIAEELFTDSSPGTVTSYQPANFPPILQDDVNHRPHHRKTKIGPGRNHRGVAKRQTYSKEKRLQTKKARDIGICIQCRHVRKPVSHVERYSLAQSTNISASAYPVPSANASAARRKPLTYSGCLVFAIRLSIAFSFAPCRICPTRALSQWLVDITVDLISRRPGSTPRLERYVSLRIGAQFSACLYAGSNRPKTTSGTIRVLAVKDEDYLQSLGR
jgi:hypothetical protein